MEKNESAVKFYLREMFEIVSKQTDGSTEEAEYKMRWEEMCI